MEFSALRRLRFLANLTDDRVDDMVINNDLNAQSVTCLQHPFRSSSLPSVMPSVNSIPSSHRSEQSSHESFRSRLGCNTTQGEQNPWEYVAATTRARIMLP